MTAIVPPAGTGYPFGNPDGARADLHDLMTDFVGLNDESAHTALRDPADDLSARIFVGQMGAGKTVYLRRSYAIAADESRATYADNVRSDVPPTEEIVRVSADRKPQLVTEMWTRIWRAAIARSLTSHLLCAPQLKPKVAYDVREALEGLGALLGRPRTPHSAYAEVSEILHQYRSRGALDRYLSAPGWHDAMWHLAEALRQMGAVYFHLDAVDEQFAHAPIYWLRFQTGMFLAVMELLRTPEFGGRLHVVACVRDLVYSNVLRSEHASRYRDEPHIRSLDWKHADIRSLLEAKIARLSPEYRMDPAADTVAGWLGTRTVPNQRRRVSEAIDDYILRHTRLLPRDIVVIGNALSREVAAARRQGHATLSEQTIRAVLHEQAGGFADMQLRVSANHVASDLMPPEAVGQGYADVFLGDTEVSRGIVADLRAVVAAVGRDRFDGLALDRARRQAAELIGGKAPEAGIGDIGLHVLDVLWQNGLVGYECDGGGRAAFYADLTVNDFHLPLDQSRYVFHPSLAHTVYLEPIGEPVKSW